uniref:Membrane protein of ER body-like protein isoform X4 n=1 Tax=Elaeis guineensis var. tenera TaxID=51953 RepID=A0A6I9S7B1_ELAGV|nr:membrane protein of ER body-like protein isoform X4 [Elaeis guineensis]
MEKDRKWEEAALEEEEEIGALEVRQRRRDVNARENENDSSEEKKEVVEAGLEGEQRSVYYDKEQGVEITPEAALMKLDNEDQFAAEKDATNGKVYFRTKKFHGQEDIPVQEANNILKNTKVENGSNSQHYSEGYSENEITRSQHEIDGDKEIKIVKKSEIKVSDVDLERVLEEQDTHDLFCPNCNSCITRRVILRKRKRSERSAEETESDASEKKTHKVPHDVDSSLVTAEKTDLDDREPDVFRCLSCFSFFIPTAGSTLPEESHTSSSRQMEDPSQRYKQSTVAQPVVEVTLHDQFQMNNEEKLSDTILNNYRGDDIIQVPEIGSTLSDESIHGPLVPAVVVPPHAEIQIPESEQSVREAQGKNDWDVLKSIVYGGLIESVTSLSVVSSAAGTDASTLKIVALGLANLAGGFFVIVHDLFELRNAQDEATDQKGEPAGRYWEVLGRRANFKLHATIAILSYLLVGIMPPLIYGFSFRESNNTEYKLIAVAAAGLLCISLLAIGKAHVKPQKAYIKYLLSYLSLGVSASGLSYVAGLMISRLLEKLGLFDSNASVSAPPSIIHRDISSTVPAWASY